MASLVRASLEFNTW